MDNMINETKKKYDLSFPQKNIMMVEKFFGATGINSIIGIFKIENNFDEKLCQAAINKLIELNDGLRIQLCLKEDKYLQYITEYTWQNIECVDLSLIEDTKEDLNAKFMSIPFNIQDSPLYYFVIVRTSKNSGYIYIKYHHIIADAWSYSITGESLAKYICMFEDKNNEKLDGLTLKNPSYIEFLDSEKEYIASDRYLKDKEFWKEYLSGTAESVSLKDSAYVGVEAARYTTCVEPNLYNKINKFCFENKVSPYIVFLNAVAIYIYKTTFKTDYIIGTPILGRSSARQKSISGMFISTIPVRFKIDEKLSFKDMCQNMSREMFTLFRHQKYPYFEMLEDFKKENNINSNMYNVMVSYQNARIDYNKIDGIDNKYNFSTEWVFNGKSQNEFIVHITDMDDTGTLELHIDYLKEVFSYDEIKYIAARLFKIIEDGISGIEKIEDICIIPDEEKLKILGSYNGVVMPYPEKSVVELFCDIAKTYPQNIALVFEDKKVTYKMLDKYSTNLALKLSCLGIKPQDFVGVHVEKGIDLIICILAILKCGACYVPIEKTHNLQRKMYVINDAKCNMVLTDEEFVNIHKLDEGIQKNGKFKIINISEKGIKDIIWSESENEICQEALQGDKKDLNFKDLNFFVNSTPDSPNCVLYTSGTTGNPKGAIIVDRNIVKLVKNADYLTFESEDNILQAASTSFDVSLFEIWGALLNGAVLHCIRKTDLINAKYLKAYLENNKISILWITSALFNQMIELDASMFKHLRRIFTGGDVISIKHVGMLQKACPNLQITNCYGPTECVAFTNIYDIKKEEIENMYLNNTNTLYKKLPIGKAISNTSGYVVDKKGNILPLYVAGEYVIGGDSVGIGYINNEKLTNEKFVLNYIDDKNKFKINRMYKTGDIVQMLNGGIIDFIGRRDNQIKINGYRIELDEIKLAMQNYGSVKDAVAIVESIEDKKRIIAYYTSSSNENKQEFLNYLRLSLPFYMVPSILKQLDVLPINQNGKLDRAKLKKMLDDKDSTNNYVNENAQPIYDGIYKDIYEAYKEVLKIDNINMEDSFFEIGGDSILVIKLISILSNKNIDVTYQEIYKYPSIRALGDMLSKSKIKESISKGIENIDYTDIDKLLSKNKIENKSENMTKSNSKNKKKEILNNNLLLTGATGFLGAHILDEYIKQNPKAKVYCLVRKQDNVLPKVRLEEKLKYFFGNKRSNEILKKVVVVEGDIAYDSIFDADNEKQMVINNVSVIINSAAYVKHYGNLDTFKNINTDGVKRLAIFALEHNMKFIQISTLSVSGNILENGQIEQTNISKGTIFDETKLYIGQNLDNVYAYTKFLAEKFLYDKMLETNLDAKIIRMGNLTGRYVDGHFQPNPENNAFALRLKTLISLKVAPENLFEFDVEFTPIDYAAYAICLIANESSSNNTYHVFNNNHIKFKDLKIMLEKYGYVLKDITKSDMTSLIEGLMQLDYTKIQGIAQDLNSKYELDYTPNTVIKEDNTLSCLKDLGFEWPVLDYEYIKKYLDDLVSIGFLDENKGEK